MNTRDRQKGFLAIVSIAIVVIVAFIAVTATYQYAGDSLSSATHLRSAQALQIAQSGIEQGKHDIVVNGLSCSGYNSGTVTFTPPSGSGAGQYQVTGTTSSANSNLNGAITSSATSITLSNAAAFSTPGAVAIDNEIVSYSGKSGNTLTGVLRGLNGSAAVAHSSGAIVQQNQCYLTSTAGIPSINSANGKRILRALIIGTSFGFNVGGNFVIPSASGSGNFNLQGSAIVRNPSVTLNGPGFPASNIITTQTVQWTGSNAQTQTAGGVKASSRDSELLDIQENTTLFNSSNYFSQYFNQTQSQVRSAAITNGNFYAGGSNILGLTGRVIWYDGNLSLTADNTIGTTASPVLLIVNGNLTMRGHANITGFVFVTGSTDIAGGGGSDNPEIAGSLATAGDVLIAGNAIVTLDQDVLNSVNNISGNMNTTYSNNAVTLQEIFP